MSLDQPKVLLMAPTCVAAININVTKYANKTLWKKPTYIKW